ncbi:MAG TPA: trigger factor [Polyangiaceae bacterium]|nr:trigger factor [Polyangiaceae bacterium]
MESQISEISPVLVQVSVEVPWPDVEKAIEGSYSQLGRTAKVKGFRPGKVPRTVLKQLFGPRVKREVVNNLIEQGLGRAVEQHRLTVVSVPPLESMPELKQGEPLAFTAKLEVRPKIEHVDIQGIQLERPAHQISDERLAEELERLRQQHAELVTPESSRPIQDGDIVTSDYKVWVDGVERLDLAATARPIDTSGALLPELKAGLLGKSPGETVRVELTFPESQGGEFGGKPGVFEISIKELKEKVLPDLDDEFAKDLEFASLEELRQKTRERLEASAHQHGEAVLQEQLLDKLLEKNPIELPPSLVAQQEQAMLQEYLRIVQRTGQAPSDAASFLEGTKRNAERRVRTALLLGAVATQHGIRVEPADLDKRLEEIAQRSGKHVAKVRAELSGERGEALESQILEAKLLEYLLGQATITEAAS